MMLERLHASEQALFRSLGLRPPANISRGTYMFVDYLELCAAGQIDHKRNQQYCDYVVRHTLATHPSCAELRELLAEDDGTEAKKKAKSKGKKQKAKSAGGKPAKKGNKK